MRAPPRPSSRLERVRRSRNISRLAEARRDDLPAHRQPADAPDRHRDRRNPGEVRRDREDIAEVHLVRVGDRADRERGRGGRRREQRVHAGRPHVGEIARDERAHLLRLAVVGVVVAGGEHVRAEQDAARDLRAEARCDRVASYIPRSPSPSMRSPYRTPSKRARFAEHSAGAMM